MNEFLVYSGLKTPDGTILHSTYRHDFKSHIDKNGKLYFIDGGLVYSRHSYNKDEELIKVYSNDDFEKVRQYCYRNGYGKPGSKDYGDFRTTFLKDMTDEHLNALPNYCAATNRFLSIYEKEIEYRKINNISIKGEDK